MVVENEWELDTVGCKALDEIKSNVMRHMRRIQPYSEMLTYEPLTNNAVKQNMNKNKK
jgi:hypothetical protein